jgi:integrase
MVGHGTDTEPADITLTLVRGLERPAQGNRIIYDSQIPGFGVRITSSGAIAFILNYTIHGRERRYTIGRYPEYKPAEARNEALELRKGIREGIDPLEVRVLDRTAPLVSDLADKYIEHAERSNRPQTLRNKRQMLNAIVLPHLGRLQVAAVTSEDICRVHTLLKATPYLANRARAFLSAMFSFAIDSKLRLDNPVTKTGVPKYPEQQREKWLDARALARLSKALDKYHDQRGANAVRLLIYTGSRKHEVLQARWEQFDLGRAVWTKPSAHTKQKKVEHVPLGTDALKMLQAMKRDGDFLFPSPRVLGMPLENLRNVWTDLCKAAGLDGFRIHDIRHSFASHLVSAGTPIATVGRLMGHTQAATTSRYAHFADSPLRDAVNVYGKIVEKGRRRGRK